MAVTRSASPRSSRYTGLSSFPPSCTVQRPGFSIGSRSGYWSGFISAACARNPQESQPAQHRVHLASGAAALAGHATRMEDVRMPKAAFFSELQEGKRDRGPSRKRYKDQLNRQLAQAGISHQSWQQEASDRDIWHSSVRKASCEFEAERHTAAQEKRKRQKE